MNICRDEKKTTVKVEVREYLAEQQSFLNDYLVKLVSMEFIKPCPQAPWQAAPHAVSKDSKARLRMTIVLRPVNATTIAEL